MTTRLKGKVCVITGASSGIGLAIATAMQSEGAVVTGIDLHTNEQDKLTMIQADVSDEASINTAVDHIHAEHGRIDVLVNNAGIWAPGTVATTDQETWDRVFAVNVRGVYLTGKAVIPHMQREHAGSIVNISSNYGLVGGVNAAAYTASKGAIVTLTYAMALDHAQDGIRVNCVCPGTIDTPLIRKPMATMTKKELEAQHASRVRRHPLGRIGSPGEVAPGVVYLASDEASFVTGAVLSIDGGYVAR
jgi:NAD(P)-dependent dehydrogenase (short-subunit alcohol dehydrogenase family)